MALYRSLGARPDETRGTTALEVRKDLARIFTGPGVLPGADSPLVVGSDVFAYVVRSAGWVTSRGEGDGVHLWGNGGDLTVAEADDGSSLVAPAPGLSRIDVIYALHPSDSENGDTTSEPLVAVRKGVEASVPVAPSLPVGGLELARNTMTSAATSTSSAGNTIEQTARPAAVIGTRLGRHARYRATAGSSIPHRETTLLGAWNGSTYRDDPAGDWSATSGTSATALFTGKVRVRADIRFAPSPNGTRIVQINRNGSSVKIARVRAVGDSLATDVVAEYNGHASEGDVFEVLAWQNSGGPLNLEVSAHGTGFIVERTA